MIFEEEYTEEYTEEKPNARFDETDPFEKECMTYNELKRLEDEIREKVRIFCETKNAFDTDENADDVEYVPAHSRENAIVELLYEYVIHNPRYVNRYKVNEYNLYEYGPAIFLTCLDVLRTYEVQKGDIIRLFNFAIKRTLIKERGKVIYEIGHQRKPTSENKLRIIGKLVREEKKRRHEGTVDVDRVLEMANEIDETVTKDEIVEYLSCDVRLDLNVGEDSDDSTLGTLIPDESIKENDDRISYYNKLEFMIKKIDEAFLESKDYQRGYLSDALTVLFCETIDKAFSDYYGIEDILDKTEWFNRKVFEDYVETRELPTQKDIANQHGVTNVTVSRGTRGLLQDVYSDVKYYIVQQ